MRKLNLTLLLLICTQICFGQQITLTGTVIGGGKQDTVEVNEFYDGNYWKKKSVNLRLDAVGNFQVSYPYQATKFVMLIYKQTKQWLLLSPGRPLHVTIHATTPINMFSFSGKGKVANDLVQKLKMEDVQSLPFIKELKLRDSYSLWSVDSVINIKLPMIKHSLDSALQLVRQSNLPLYLRTAISTEIKYFYADAVSQNLGSALNTGKNRASFHTQFIDRVLSDFTVPTEDELHSSVSANSYLDNYFRLKLWRAMYIYRTSEDRNGADSVFRSYTGVTFSELSNDPNRTNELYLFSTRLVELLPRYAWEKNLTNVLLNFCMSGQLQSAAKIFDFIKANSTNRQYLNESEKMYAPLRRLREQYANNLNIKIRPDYKKLSSLKELLAPYQGKVVFLDMWGTWCPHCVEQMNFVPALKERFKGQDIVFLYIARNEDSDDEAWRDFIFINNLTGEHVRRTADQIASLWNELGIADGDESYPYYFIFDRSGNLIISDAKRPSSGDALYLQLRNVLH